MAVKKRLPRIARGGRRALSTMEMAIVLPLLLLMIAGIIEYGWMFLRSQGVTNAAREGARTAVLTDVTAEEITEAIQNAMAGAGLGNTDYEVTFPLGNPVEALPGDQIAVRIRVKYSEISLGMPLIPKPGALGSTTTMMKEGTD